MADETVVSQPPDEQVRPKEESSSTYFQAHIEEYVALRQEMLEVIKLQRQVFALAVGLSAAALPFFVQTIKANNTEILLIVPIPLSVFALIHISLEAQHLTIGRYIYTILRPKIQVDSADANPRLASQRSLWEWEQWHRGPEARRWPVLRIRSLLSAIEFIVLLAPSPIVLLYWLRAEGIDMQAGQGIVFAVDFVLALISVLLGLGVLFYRRR